MKIPRFLLDLFVVGLNLWSFTSIHGQQDSLVNCFPLAVGNRWEYRFEYVWLYDIYYQVDTGRVTYAIIGMDDFPDSTVWLTRQERDLIHEEYRGSYVRTPIRDTIFFNLVELHSGRHRLYKQVFQYDDMHYSIFPFFRDMVDTAAVYRFWNLDSSNTVSTRIPYPTTPRPLYVYDFTFARGIGLVSMKMHYALTFEGIEKGNHQLLAQTIVSVRDGAKITHPSGTAVLQCYPNPFNSSTLIQYSIPSPMHVVLTIYDLTGRKVALLQNDKQTQGAHSLYYEAKDLSSGTYFIQLSAGNLRVTRRMAIIK